MYTVDIYTVTNFNPVNLPYDPSVLQASAKEHFTLPAIDVVQNYFLTSISVSGSQIEGSFWDKIKLADYCKVGEFYYFITGVQMTSPDVARLSLVPDFFTSARALGAIHHIAGTVIRWRVPEEDDTFGTYTAEDDILTPQEPLVLKTGNMVYLYSSDTKDTSNVYVESTIDLGKISKAFTKDDSTYSGWKFNGDGFGITVQDPSDPEKQCTFPFVPGSDKTTDYSVLSKTLPIRGTAIYRYDDVVGTLGLLQSLNVLNGILKIYQMPVYYAPVAQADDDGYIKEFLGSNRSDIGSFPFEYAKVKNKRLLYGSYNEYGLITSSGAKLEASPEFLTGGGYSSPHIRMVVDPRPNGSPYFRFEYFNKDNSDAGFWNNAIKGSNWIEVPVSVRGEAGSFLSYGKIGTTIAQVSNRYLAEQSNSVRGIGNIAANAGINVAGQLASNELSSMSADESLINNYAVSGIKLGSYDKRSDAYGRARAIRNLNYNSGQAINSYNSANRSTGVVTTLGQAGVGIADTTGGMIQNYYNYENAKQMELANFGLNHTVVTPSVQFTPDNQIIRDMYGNGVVPYRYHYSSNDLRRIDQLLTMYGYALSKPFSLDMINKHSDFDYVQVSGVQVYGDNLPMWWTQGITNQLNAGTRIWHVRPDNKYYMSDLTYEIDDEQITKSEGSTQ